MSLTKIINLTLLLALAGLMLTGAGGRWTMPGLSRNEWNALHTNLSILFLATAVLFALRHLGTFLSGLKKKKGRFRLLNLNFSIALLLTGWIVLGTLLNWPPFACNSTLENPQLHETAREPETKSFPEKMPLFFSRRALAGICAEYGMEPDTVIQALKNVGIKADARASIRTIAEENDTEPSVIFEALRQMK